MRGVPGPVRRGGALCGPGWRASGRCTRAEGGQERDNNPGGEGNVDKARQHPGALVTFFQGFLKRPQQVASLVPSSRFLERRLVEVTEAPSARTIVELGPGTGGTTRALLQAMRKDATLLAVEINPHFLAVLGQIKDRRVVVHQGDAADISGIIASHGLPAPDVVISGIPFSTMPRPRAEAVLRAVFDALAPGGRFVAYQVRDRVESLGRVLFGPPQTKLELRNIPPIRVYRWNKSVDGVRTVS